MRSINFIRLNIVCAVLIYSACGLEYPLKTYEIILKSDGKESSNAIISTSYDLVCSTVFGGSINYTQNSIVVSGTSGSIQILQNLTCTLSIASFFDGSTTYTPTSSALVITISAAGVVSSSGSLSSPPQYNNGSGTNLYLFLTASTSSSLTFKYAYDPVLQTASIVSSCISSTCPSKPALSSIAASFNSSSINAGRFIWFSNNFTVSGINTALTTNIFISDATVTFTSGSTYTINFPDGVITLSPAASCGTTTFSQSTWQTIFPTSFVTSNNIFGQGVSMPVGTTLPGSISPVSYQARFYADQPGVSITWQWGAAVYDSNMNNYSTLGVKSAKQNDCTYNSADMPGTPENKKTSIKRGATGNGTSQYTGAQSSTATLSPSNCIPVCQGNFVRCPLVCQSAPIYFTKY